MNLADERPGHVTYLRRRKSIFGRRKPDQDLSVTLVTVQPEAAIARSVLYASLFDYPLTLAQLRRFTDGAGLAMTPVLRIARETVDATVAAWQGLDEKDLVPRDIARVIGNQIESVAGRSLH